MTWAASYIGRSDFHCWGFVRTVYENELGIQLPEYGEVNARDLHEVASAVREGVTVWHPVLPFPGAEKPFDVVLMKGWLPCSDGVARRANIHTGVVTRRGYVVHTDLSYTVVEVPLRNQIVRGKLVACYRHSSLAAA